MADSGARVVRKFNGLSNLDSDNLNGFAITPPDQGLCVGRDNTLSRPPERGLGTDQSRDPGDDSERDVPPA